MVFKINEVSSKDLNTIASYILHIEYGNNNTNK